MTPALKKIIEDAYRVFGTYKVTKPLDVCTACCVTDDEENDLVNLDVRYISHNLLTTYNNAAKPERPELNEFKHFLPRFLDLTAQFKYPSHSLETGLSGFKYFSDEDWSREERQIIEEFGKEFFQYCLETYPLPDNEHIEAILIMLSTTQMDTNQLFSYWKDTSTEESLLHFSDLVNYGFELKQQEKLSDAFADQEVTDKITQWLGNSSIRTSFAKKIEHIIMKPGDISDRQLTELSWAYDRLM